MWWHGARCCVAPTSVTVLKELTASQMKQTLHINHPIVAVCLSDMKKVLSESREEKLVRGSRKAVWVGLLQATNERKRGLSWEDINFFRTTSNLSKMSLLTTGMSPESRACSFCFLSFSPLGVLCFDRCSWVSCLSWSQEERGGGDEEYISLFWLL